MVPSMQAPRPRARLALDALRTAAGLGLFGLMGLLWAPFALLLHALLPARQARRLGRRLIHVGFRGYLRVLAVLGACRFDLSALDALREQGPMIIAPNHPSLIDALLVISRLRAPACVMKSSILGNPVLGAGARLAGYIGNDDLRRMIDLAVEDLRDGYQLLLFPEGTRSRVAPIGPVKGMVGLIAKRAGVPVQTVLIETDSNFLGKSWNWRDIPRLPITYRVRLGPRLPPPAHAQEFVAELETCYRRALRDALPALPRAGFGHDHDPHA
ncbi:MAG: 1-acyl-sn-glycerol-3-phosphate acyltransferase [Betaproteobacteria bacterium]|nr:1-acyl-sn-glycerol-3-phosphate acyltransferase [Betaproteobacteria bacterium]